MIPGFLLSLRGSNTFAKLTLLDYTGIGSIMQSFEMNILSFTGQMQRTQSKNLPIPQNNDNLEVINEVTDE